MENVTPQQEENKAGQGSPADLAAQAAADEALAGGDSEKNDSEFEALTVDLEGMLETHKDLLNTSTKSGNPYQIGKEELDSFGATAETRMAMIDRLRKFLKAQGVAA